METDENKSKVLHRLVFHRAITILVNAPCSVAVVDDGKGHEKVFCFLQHRQKGVKQSCNNEDGNNIKVDNFLNHSNKTTTYAMDSSCAKDLCPLKDFQSLAEQDMSHFVHYLRWTYPLPIAVRLGNLPLVHYLIKKGTYVDVWGYNFATPLYTAASHVLCNDKILVNTSSQDVEGSQEKKKHIDSLADHSTSEALKQNSLLSENNSRLKMVYLLLKNGAPVDAPDLYSVKCPINAAIKNDNQDLLELFLACGATVNVRMLNQNIIPPLIQLSKRQQQKKRTVKGLARLGYKSPLFVACELQAWRCVSVLLNHKADPHWRDPFSYRNVTPTLLAYRKNSAMLRLFVLKGAGSTEETRWVLSEVLAAAILQDDVQTISFLIGTYPDLMYRESSGMWSLPLHQASRLNKIALVQRLLQLGNEPNVTNNESLTPLHFASSEGNRHIIELLVKNGADVDRIGGPQLNTPLHMAVEENHIEAVELLLKLNANVTIKNIAGMTPLMVAIVARHDKVAPLLIQHASVEALDTLDDNNRSALFYAIHFCQFKVADFLVDKGVCLQLTDSANATAESLLLEKIHSFKKTNLSLNKLFWNFVNVTSKANTYHTTALTGKLENSECFKAYGRSMCDAEKQQPDQALDESVKKLTNKRKKLAKQLLTKIRSRFKKPHCTTAGLTSNFLSTSLPHVVYPHIMSHKSQQIATGHISSSSSQTNQSD
ncbi:ankyrin-1-like isoform X2 [Hylaeus volcanicus]|nr:ankyrin-1-like isoform X2 [Hylaeus volcanicus]